MLALLPPVWVCVPEGLNAQGAPEAVNAIVEDTTQCKFEATSPASDEVVLFNILQVGWDGDRCVVCGVMWLFAIVLLLGCVTAGLLLMADLWEQSSRHWAADQQ